MCICCIIYTYLPYAYTIYIGAPSCMTTLAINLGIVLASSIVGK